MAETKLKILKELEILRDTDINHPVRTSQIIAKLAEDPQLENIERRSVYRDMALLSSLGYIEQCSDKKKGWYYKNHPFNDAQLLLLAESANLAGCISKENAVKIYNTLLNMSPKSSREKINSIIRPAFKEKDNNQDTAPIVEDILDAINDKVKLSFRYTRIGMDLKKELKNAGLIYKVTPVTIYLSSGLFYLIALKDEENMTKTFRLDRMVDFEVLKEPGRNLKKVLGNDYEKDVKEYLDSSINNFSGKSVAIGLDYTVDTDDDIWKTAYLYDFAGNDISIRKMADGKIRARFEKIMSKTLVRWCVQYADVFKVVYPKELKNEVLDSLNTALKNYES